MTVKTFISMVGKVAIVALSTIVHILPLRKHYQQNANYFLFFFFIFPTNLFIIVKKVLPLQPKKVKTSAEPWQKAVAKQMIQGTIICIQPVLVDQINFYPI